MGVESLALGLVAAALFISFLSFVGAHNTPLPLPDFSRFGCLTSVALVLGAFLISIYTPVSELSACSSACDAAVGKGTGATGELADVVARADETYAKCVKGAAEARKRREEEGGIKVEDETQAETEARCLEHAVTNCSRECFNPPEVKEP